jgi:hypothetical protein
MMKEPTSKAINEPVKSDKTYPPSKSASPDNGYYLKGCDAVQHSPAYAACLFKIKFTQDDKPVMAAPECICAIKDVSCAALEMKQSEELKGVAMFFFERSYTKTSVKTNLSDDHYGATLGIGKGTKRQTGGVVRQQSRHHAPEGDECFVPLDGYAAAINAAIASETKTPEPTKVEPVKAPPVEIEPVKPSPPIVMTPKEVTPSVRPAMLAGESPLQYARRVAASRN